MATVNRGWLKRQIKAGNVYMVGSYNYDDMRGADRTADVCRPVEVLEAKDEHGRYIRTAGAVGLYESDFTTKSGCAYESGKPGGVTLIVHSNCNYDLVVDGWKGGKVAK